MTAYIYLFLQYIPKLSEKLKLESNMIKRM